MRFAKIILANIRAKGFIAPQSHLVRGHGLKGRLRSRRRIAPKSHLVRGHGLKAYIRTLYPRRVWSHLVRGHGLKDQLLDVLRHIAYVASRAGTWVESLSGRYVWALWLQSHLVRGHGLKATRCRWRCGYLRRISCGDMG